jgi:hypothetical protein
VLAPKAGETKGWSFYSKDPARSKRPTRGPPWWCGQKDAAGRRLVGKSWKERRILSTGREDRREDECEKAMTQKAHPRSLARDLMFGAPFACSASQYRTLFTRLPIR